jgi:hypothetical protein
MTRIAMTILLLALSTSTYGQVYKWVDKDGKVQYTDTPPPDGAKSQAPVARPSPARSASDEAKGKSDAKPPGSKQDVSTGAKFRPEEEVALGMMCAIAFVEGFECAIGMKRYCSFDELLKKTTTDGKQKYFEKDPNTDPNYQYRVDIRGEDIAISAISRKPGLAGFFNDGNGVTYNPNGQAGKNDKRVQGGVNCKGFTK